MDSWRVIDLSAFAGQVSYRRGQLVVCSNDGASATIPLADVATVLLGLNVGVGPSVLHQLAKFDVITLICGWSGVPSAGMYAWSTHTRVGARQRAQASMTLPRRKNAWGQIVRAKVAGQAANLRHFGSPDWHFLAAMARDVRSGDPNNVEGRAARYYWARLFVEDEDGFSRCPQGASGRNALLDYGYAVLRGYGVRAVLSAGLSSSVGVFHRNRSNAFNLVDDLIEPFRPAIDCVVAGLPVESSLEDRSVKEALVESSTQAFTSAGASVATTLTDLAQQLGRYAEGDIDRLTVPAWSGPQTQEILEHAS
ncbi:MAG: type II CRISPR-associated endonuclease Cas1 [Thermoleophilia bacterium]